MIYHLSSQTIRRFFSTGTSRRRFLVQILQKKNLDIYLFILKNANMRIPMFHLSLSESVNINTDSSSCFII